MRGKNLNAPEWIEGKKIGVTRYDVGRTATHSEFEEHVVLRITASCNPHVHINPLSLAGQGREETSNIFLINIPPELFSAQNLVEFGKHGKGKQNFSLLERQIKSLSRLRIGQEQCADQDVRIQDAAQLCALQKGIQHLRCESPSLCLTSHFIEHLL